MQGTTVPKAAVNKHSQALLGKNEARPAEQLCATSPALDRVSFQHRFELQLSGLVSSRANACHGSRACGRCVNITHPRLFYPEAGLGAVQATPGSCATAFPL